MKIGKLELDKIYCGDCRDLTKDLPNNSIDMVITSPPYWGGLRDYGKETKVIWDGEENCKHKWIHTIIPPKHKDNGKTKSTLAGTKTQEQTQRTPTEFDFCSKCRAWRGQLGVEPDFNLYIKHLCDIFDEVKRVLKSEGTCWVNIGDTYSAGGGAGSGEYRKRHTQFGKIMESKSQSLPHKTKDYPTKSLVMIPFRFAIEMVNRGWILRNVIIWHKPNCMPSSAKDRFTVDFEYLFFFSKSKKYYFEQQLENNKDTWGGRWGKYTNPKMRECGRGAMSNAKEMSKKEFEEKYSLYGRNKRTVWSITTKGFKEAHFAVFPPKLIETPIKAGCPEFVCKKCGKAKIKIYKVIGKKKVPPIGGIKHQANINPTYSGNTEQQVKKELGYKALCNCNVGFECGIVLDPFIGSGTTGKVALKQGKHFIGFEINPDYIKIANKRLANIQVSML